MTWTAADRQAVVAVARRRPGPQRRPSCPAGRRHGAQGHTCVVRDAAFDQVPSSSASLLKVGPRRPSRWPRQRVLRLGQRRCRSAPPDNAFAPHALHRPESGPEKLEAVEVGEAGRECRLQEAVRRREPGQGLPRHRRRRRRRFRQHQGARSLGYVANIVPSPERRRRLAGSASVTRRASARCRRGGGGAAPRTWSRAAGMNPTTSGKSRAWRCTSSPSARSCCASSGSGVRGSAFAWMLLVAMLPFAGFRALPVVWRAPDRTRAPAPRTPLRQLPGDRDAAVGARHRRRHGNSRLPVIIQLSRCAPPGCRYSGSTLDLHAGAPRPFCAPSSTTSTPPTRVSTWRSTSGTRAARPTRWRPRSRPAAPRRAVPGAARRAGQQGVPQAWPARLRALPAGRLDVAMEVGLLGTCSSAPTCAPAPQDRRRRRARRPPAA